ncbi:MAG: hypothetical protein H8E98_06910 [Bacteroidetes bacterium]|nr:hypothetical protein [Bacteroidota bacterium]
MSEFNFELNLAEITEPEYLLTVHSLEPEGWSTFDDEPKISEKDGITYVTIRLIEDGEIVPDIEIPLTKPENADHIEVTVKAVDEDGNDLGEPKPKKIDKIW